MIHIPRDLRVPEILGWYQSRQEFWVVPVPRLQHHSQAVKHLGWSPGARMVPKSVLETPRHFQRLQDCPQEEKHPR